MRNVAHCVQMVALALVAVAPVAGQYAYTVLPPTPDLPNDGTVSTWSAGINNGGQVAGYETDPTGNHFIVVWTNGVPAKLPLPAGYIYEFAGIEINDSGQVLSDLKQGSVTGANVPVLWTAGVPASLPAGPNACGGANPVNVSIDLNNQGHVLGVTLTTSCATYWIYDGQAFHTITPPLLPAACPSNTFSVSALNNHDEVVGVVPPPDCPPSGTLLPIVIKPDGTFTLYSVPQGLKVSYVSSLNDLDEVDGGGTEQGAVALFWQTAGANPAVFHSPRAGRHSPTPDQLNRRGQFVLTVQNDAGQFAYVVKQGKLTYLAPHGTVYVASGGPINNAGQIAAQGIVGGNLNWARALWITPGQ